MTAPRYAPHRPLPSLTDWALAALNIAFVAGGLLVLFKNPAVGLVTIAFFGSCLVVSGGTVLRKLRAHRFKAERIDVAGGVPIRPSTTLLPMLGGWLTILGIILFAFGGDYPPMFRILAVLVAVCGVVVLGLGLTGRFPGGFLQFDPEGFTIAQRRWRARIPWDDITGVHEGEFASNPVLLLDVADPTRIDIAPANAQAVAMCEMGRMRARMGADIAIMTRNYGIELPLLATTVAHYVHDKSARADLRPRLS